MKNVEVLDGLWERGAIALRRGTLFDRLPEPRKSVPFDRLEGMMLGLAIGDALGNTSEGLLPGHRRVRHGEIIDYLPNWNEQGRRVGLPSDDTQMAAWTLEQLIRDSCYVPERVAAEFCSGRIFGMGSTVRQFIAHHKDAGISWQEAGPRSAGNGALMRIAPIVFPHLRSSTPDLWSDTALLAMTTHNDNASISSCLAFVNLLWDALACEETPQPDWWTSRFIEILEDLNDGTRYRPRGGTKGGFDGTFSVFVRECLEEAREKHLDVLCAGEIWFSGAFLLETVPSVLYILATHGHDPEQAIIRAVNDTKDNDTVAAIVGAAVGALHGRKALPERWVNGLLGRTREHDDGRLFELLEESRAAFC